MNSVQLLQEQVSIGGGGGNGGVGGMAGRDEVVNSGFSSSASSSSFFQVSLKAATTVATNTAFPSSSPSSYSSSLSGGGKFGENLLNISLSSPFTGSPSSSSQSPTTTSTMSTMKSKFMNRLRSTMSSSSHSIEGGGGGLTTTTATTTTTTGLPGGVDLSSIRGGGGVSSGGDERENLLRMRSSTLDSIMSTPASSTAKSSSWSWSSWSMLKNGGGGGNNGTSVNSTLSGNVNGPNVLLDDAKTTSSSSYLTIDHEHDQHHLHWTDSVVDSGGGGSGSVVSGWTTSYDDDYNNERAKASARTVSQVALGGMESLWRQKERSSGSGSTSTTLSSSISPFNLTSIINATTTSISSSGLHSQKNSDDLVDIGGGGIDIEEDDSGWLQNVSQNVTSTFNHFSDPQSLYSSYEQQLQQQEDPLSLAAMSSSFNMILNDSAAAAASAASNILDNSSYFGNMTDELGGNGTGLGMEATFYNYWALLLIVFPVFTVFGNVLVILSVKRERSLHNVTNYFIVSLAVADLMVAAIVMPFAIYFLFRNMMWELPIIFCDFYIAMDVMCSTSSICNLVAISIDRFIAVTRPIKYAKPKSTTRVWLTIVIVWVFSTLVGSPIVLGLNNPPEGRDVKDCSFYNKYFVLVSSLCSFYIPCSILVFLYYRIFKVIRGRAKNAMSGAGGGGGGRKVAGSVKGGTVIENLAQTKRLADTALGGSSTLPIPKSNNIDENDEKLTNTGSGSQEDGDDLDKDDGDMDPEVDGEDVSPDSDDCHIIPNNQATTSFIISEAAKEAELRNAVNRGNVEPNGNHDSGYAPSNMEDALAPGQEPSPASPKLSLVPPDQCKRNGLSSRLKEDEPVLISPGEVSTGSNKKTPASRFTICKVHKASRKKREKSSAKRERKATKTLAIVLGLFLLCWLPFFTCNIMDALCSVLNKDCSPSLALFLTTTWLGYINSCLNPVIYTIFNPEFRKAFKKIMGFTT